MKQCILIGFLLISLQGSAQDYMRSAGIRGGFSPGLTFRTYLDPQLAYEGLLSFRENGLQFTVLRQHFKPTLWNLSEGFFLTYGYGGHLGFTNCSVRFIIRTEDSRPSWDSTHTSGWSTIYPAFPSRWDLTTNLISSSHCILSSR
jgi:hypothetical protein